jgi:hypothetical protein
MIQGAAAVADQIHFSSKLQKWKNSSEIEDPLREREREREREIPQIIDAPLEPWTQKPQPGNKHNKNNSRPNYRSTTKTEANPLEKS